MNRIKILRDAHLIAPDFERPDLSKYRHISTTTQGGQTYKRDEPKPMSRKTMAKAGVLRLRKTSILKMGFIVDGVAEVPKPNMLNKYERRKYQRMLKHVDRHYPF